VRRLWKILDGLEQVEFWIYALAALLLLLLGPVFLLVRLVRSEQWGWADPGLPPPEVQSLWHRAGHVVPAGLGAVGFGAGLRRCLNAFAPAAAATSFKRPPNPKGASANTASKRSPPRVGILCGETHTLQTGGMPVFTGAFPRAGRFSGRD
jgi:hypothetical protein